MAVLRQLGQLYGKASRIRKLHWHRFPISQPKPLQAPFINTYLEQKRRLRFVAYFDYQDWRNKGGGTPYRLSRTS